MAASKKRMVQANVSVEGDKWEQLKAIAAERRIPVAVLVRQGLDTVLELALKQQATIDRFHESQRTAERAAVVREVEAEVEAHANAPGNKSERND